jgi:cytochrome d oxidase subunit CydB
MEPTTLQLTWFVLLGVLMAGYAILDGFDLGVGILHLFARTEDERRVLMNSIGPIWDGNAVWLVVLGGATFAAFPNAYAAAFSGFYLGFMLLLCCLIFRGVSMEFRSKRPSRLWRGFWDVAWRVHRAHAMLPVPISARLAWILSAAFMTLAPLATAADNTEQEGRWPTSGRFTGWSTATAAATGGVRASSGLPAHTATARRS